VALPGKSQWEEPVAPEPNTYVKVPSFILKIIIVKRLLLLLQIIKKHIGFVLK
jgi:hypothetical protein